MSNTIGPHRSAHLRRTDKPYDRPVAARPQVHRSASFVQSLKAIVAKPFSWLSGGAANGKGHAPEVSSSDSDVGGPEYQSDVQAGAKRRVRGGAADHSSSNGSTRASKKARRASPPREGRLNIPSTSLRSSVSLPQLPSSSSTRNTPRPPLPHLGPRPNFSPEPQLMRHMSQTPLRGSPTPLRHVPSRRSLVPDSLQHNSFGMRSQSPFVRSMSMASVTPTAPSFSSVVRPPTLFADIGSFPPPRTTLAAHDERMRTTSPFRGSPALSRRATMEPLDESRSRAFTPTTPFGTTYSTPSVSHLVPVFGWR